MKECWVTEPLHFEMRETEIPEPKDNEVQIKMMAAGVCGSDIHIYKGENPNSRYPLIPGHENVGLVTKVGADCKNIKVGDHVVIDYVIRCGECYQCKHGRGNVCEHVLVRGSGTNGGWREYWCVEEPYVYKIDDSIPWKDAALIEPLTIGEHSTSRAGVCEDDVVFILGTGTIGTIIAQACKLKGAKTVICCDIHTRARSKRLLKVAGAKVVLGLDDLLNKSVDGSGYNAEYGLLGSNKATEETVKLFPRDCMAVAEELGERLSKASGKHIEAMVYGDGAFKDPVGKIWELADPVVSPGYTKGLVGTPNELKLKYLADNDFGDLKGEALKEAIEERIREKTSESLVGNMVSEGTTPRRLTDLIGSLCDLTSGSGDKGTPIVYIQGYFDNYSND